MKKLLTFSFIAVFGGLLILSNPIKAQDVVKKQKKVTVKTVKEENGKKVVTDTTFVVTGDMDDIDLEKYGISTDGEEMEVIVDIIGDSEGTHKTKKVIVIKGDDVHLDASSSGEKNTFIFKTDGEGEGHHKVVSWTDEDGQEMTFEIESEIEMAMEELERAHRELEIEMKVVDGEHIIMMKEMDELGELIELKELESLHALDKLHNMEYEFIMSDDSHSSKHHNYFYDGHHNKVTDVELRDAGIKNKPDRLETTDIDINIDGGVVDFSFSLKAEASPKVIVYNVYGDKVFNGKPELMNGSYTIKMDLSAKQHGTYYLQVVLGNSSFTERLKL